MKLFGRKIEQRKLGPKQVKTPISKNVQKKSLGNRPKEPYIKIQHPRSKIVCYRPQKKNQQKNRKFSISRSNFKISKKIENLCGALDLGCPMKKINSLGQKLCPTKMVESVKILRQKIPKNGIIRSKIKISKKFKKLPRGIWPRVPRAKNQPPS